MKRLPRRVVLVVVATVVRIAAGVGSLSGKLSVAVTVVRRAWESWKRVARAIGDFQARIILAVFYFVALAPFALAVRWATDPLAIKAATPKGWRARQERGGSPMERATRQF